VYDLLTRPAPHQPLWTDHPSHSAVLAELAVARALVTVEELRALRAQLAQVATGHGTVLQAGDCVESFADCLPAEVAAKLTVLDELGAHLSRHTGAAVVRVGRLAGQFAKPRSRDTERYGGRELPTFRGPMINSALATAAARRPDPRRMLRAYSAAADATALVRAHRDAPTGPWTSHEALVLDYEQSLVRTDPTTGVTYLASTYLPWIGERTRQPDGAHVRLLAGVANPVACKVGPTTTVEDLLRICKLLDPDREPGRLVLISRMGRGRVGAVLPGLAAAVRQAGHPVVWLSDPMHGNTVRTPSGLKTRRVGDIVAEAVAFRDILTEQRIHPGGLHLEVAAGDVTECVGGCVPDAAALRLRYTTLCDPRLNPVQAADVIDAWA